VRNGQRLISLRDIPQNTYMQTAALVGTDILRIHFMPEDRLIDFSLRWLQAHIYDRPMPKQVGWVKPELALWDSQLSEHLPVADFCQLQSDKQQQLLWLQKVVRYGFGKLTNGPVSDGALYQIIDLFGYIRETNYGRHFEVRVEDNPSNLAFTGAAIQAHTDNPYRDPVPSLQLLYCLQSTASGGDSMLVDGFTAAQRLRDEKPHYFDLLSRYCARFEFAGEQGVCLHTRQPMIGLAADGELTGVRFNNRSAAAFTDVPFVDMADYYAAYRYFGEILDDPVMEVAFRLAPGECVLFDNTRVLHARKAFSGSGSRWLQGCYADKDALWSKVHAAANHKVL
jgi:gamma-butyrobetaine dioxygenase